MRTDPLSKAMVFSWPSAKKPTDRLSGDQNGKDALSVPGSARGATASKLRSHSCDFPFEVAANTIGRPSGDTASEVASVVGGVEISKRSSRGPASDPRKYHSALV